MAHSVIMVSKESMTQKRQGTPAGQGFREADKEVQVVLQADAGRKEKNLPGSGWKGD